jgi:hypothetical protein
MKSGLGVGQKQGWNKRSTGVSVQGSVWVYAVLLLAGYRTWGLRGGPPMPALWGQNAGLSTPCGAVTGLRCGVQGNFGPFGWELATTGGKKKPGWPV